MSNSLRSKIVDELRKTPAGIEPGRDVEMADLGDDTFALKVDATPRLLVIVTYDAASDAFMVNKVIIEDLVMDHVKLEDLATTVYDGISGSVDGDGFGDLPLPPEGAFRPA